MKIIRVWDAPTRLFHWALAILVIANFFTGEDQGALLVVHTYAGYLAGLLVLFRVWWGFAGGEYARFAEFVRPWRDVRAYIGSFLRLAPRAHIGHNPLGGWMILLMLVVVGLLVITGMMAAAADGVVVPFFGAGGELAEELHEFLGNLMMVLAAVHVFGVFADWLLTRDNLILAMVTGRKEVRKQEARHSRPASGWRAVVALVLLALLGGYMVATTDFTGAGRHGSGAEHGDHEADD